MIMGIILSIVLLAILYGYIEYLLTKHKTRIRGLEDGYSTLIAENLELRHKQQLTDELLKETDEFLKELQKNILHGYDVYNEIINGHAENIDLLYVKIQTLEEIIDGDVDVTFEADFKLKKNGDLN